MDAYWFLKVLLVLVLGVAIGIGARYFFGSNEECKTYVCSCPSTADLKSTIKDLTDQKLELEQKLASCNDAYWRDLKYAGSALLGGLVICLVYWYNHAPRAPRAPVSSSAPTPRAPVSSSAAPRTAPQLTRDEFLQDLAPGVIGQFGRKFQAVIGAVFVRVGVSGSNGLCMLRSALGKINGEPMLEDVRDLIARYPLFQRSQDAGPLMEEQHADNLQYLKLPAILVSHEGTFKACNSWVTAYYRKNLTLLLLLLWTLLLLWIPKTLYTRAEQMELPL